MNCPVCKEPMKLIASVTFKRIIHPHWKCALCGATRRFYTDGNDRHSLRDRKGKDKQEEECGQ